MYYMHTQAFVGTRQTLTLQSECGALCLLTCELRVGPTGVRQAV